MREIFDVTHECPHCGQGVDVNADGTDEFSHGHLSPVRAAQHL